MATPASIDAYIAGLAEDRRAAIEDIRRTVGSAAPDAVETIAYSMPAFRTATGAFLVSFAAYRRHVSLFPASRMVIDALGADLAPFVVPKATIQFPADRPIPLDLVRRVTEIRVAELSSTTERSPTG